MKFDATVFLEPSTWAGLGVVLTSCVVPLLSSYPTAQVFVGAFAGFCGTVAFKLREKGAAAQPAVVAENQEPNKG